MSKLNRKQSRQVYMNLHLILSIMQNHRDGLDDSDIDDAKIAADLLCEAIGVNPTEELELLKAGRQRLPRKA